MPKDKGTFNDDTEYDVMEEAIRFGTIEVTMLFEPDDRSYKIKGSGGVTLIRIKQSSVIVGSLLFLFLVLPVDFILLRLFGSNPFAIAFAILFTGLVVFLGLRIGKWSPMEKTTGEDLLTYLKMIMRQRLSNRSSLIGGKKPSTVKLNSLAIAKNRGGMLTNCETFIGTEPLIKAPPINPYDFSEMSPFYFTSSGELKPLPVERYNDGINRNN